MNQPIIATRTNAKHFGAPESSSSKTSTDIKSNKVEKKKTMTANQGTVATKEAGSMSLHTNNDNSNEKSFVEKAFRLDAGNATEVLLLGDFTEWEKTPIRLIRGGGGFWHTKLRLPPGRHAYRFLVDGEWCNDPDSQELVSNPYGTSNSVIEVP